MRVVGGLDQLEPVGLLRRAVQPAADAILAEDLWYETIQYI